VSQFRALLDNLMNNAREDGAGAAPGLSPDFLDGVVGLHRVTGPQPTILADTPYGDAVAAEDKVAELPPADRVTVARELGLRPGMGLGELGRIRRRFARLNHPDSLPANLRPQATARMMMANMLLDEAAARLSRTAPKPGA
jgi:hypothetical protein